MFRTGPQPRNVSEKRMSDRMSEDLSERMSEDVSERMSGSCQQDVSMSVKLKVTGSSAGNKMSVYLYMFDRCSPDMSSWQEMTSVQQKKCCVCQCFEMSWWGSLEVK